jgi:hypothetical protein
VAQAVFGVDDLRDFLECEIEDMSKFPVFLDPLEEGIKSVYESMKAGTCSFAREDLPSMDLAARCSEEVPFHTLLKQINETHRHGLDVEGEDA